MSSANDVLELMPLGVSETELHAQPGAIAETLSKESGAARELAATLASSRSFDEVLLIGSGDSHYASLAVRHAVESILGFGCEALESIEAASYLARPLGRTVALVLSSSGQSQTTLRALERVRDGGATVVAVTNSPGSPIWQAADHRLTVHATRRGFPTQASTAAMALVVTFALALAAARGTESETRRVIAASLAVLPSAAQRVLDAASRWAKELAPRLRGELPVVFVGAGPSYGAAAFGRAKVKEASQGQAALLGLEEFHHIESFALAPGQVVVLVAPTGRSTARAADVVGEALRARGRPVLVTSQREGLDGARERVESAVEIPLFPEPLSPLLSVIPLQLLALELARVRVANGHLRPLAEDFAS